MSSIPEIVLYNLLNVGLVYGGAVLQKIGALEGPKFGEAKGTTVLMGFIRNRTWLVGILCSMLSIPFTMFILSITSMSFFMIFQRCGIVLVFVFAIYYLKEKVSRLEIIGLVLLYAGFVLVIFVIPPETTSTYQGDAGPIIFFIISTGIYIVSFLTYKQAGHPKLVEMILVLGAGFSGIAGTLALKLIPMALTRDLGTPGYIFNLFDFPELGRLLIGIFLPTSGYLFGSIYFYIWVISFTANFFLLMMMYQHGRAAVSIPIVNNLTLIASILFAFFVFNEEVVVLAWIGIAIMTSGIFLAGKMESRVNDADSIEAGINREEDQEIKVISGNVGTETIVEDFHGENDVPSPGAGDANVGRANAGDGNGRDEVPTRGTAGNHS